MTIETLEFLWYLVLALATTMYFVLDGFDFGVGILHLFPKKDEERRIFLNAIGPVWDGNEVWLVVIIGALFAGFPAVYAALFSGFYTMMMFLIAGLVFRAAAIEFRSKQESPRWRKFWDVIFSAASFLVAFIFGVGLGNLIEGVPLDANFEFRGGLELYFRPYPILIGVWGLFLFAMHGSIYLVMKTEGDLQRRLKRWTNISILGFLILFFVSTYLTYVFEPAMFHPFHISPWIYAVPILTVLATINIYFQMRREKYGFAFLSSCGSIFLLLATFGLGTYPYLVKSTVMRDLNSLTISNSSSSEETLRVLLLIVVIGIPLVLSYGYWVYRVFGGKVRLDDKSY